MRYVNSIQCPFKILIADGGEDQAVPAALVDQTRYPRVRYEYMRYPFDSTFEEFYAKVADALGRVDTPYVAMVDNDDFFIVDGFRHCIEFLNAHPGHAACGGAPIYFEVIPSSQPGDSNAVYGAAKGFRDIYPSHSDEQETALQRVQSYMNTWNPRWYHVRRIQELRSSWEIASNLHLDDLYWYERVLDALASVEGKIATLQLPYYLRQSNTESLARSYYSENGDMFQRMFKNTWARDFNVVVDAIATAVARKDNVARQEALVSIKTIYRLAVAKEVLGALRVEGTNWDWANFSLMLRRVIDLVRSGRRWNMSRRQIHEAKIVEQNWIKQTALKPMFELLATPEEHCQSGDSIQSRNAVA